MKSMISVQERKPRVRRASRVMTVCFTEFVCQWMTIGWTKRDVDDHKDNWNLSLDLNTSGGNNSAAYA